MLRVFARLSLVLAFGLACGGNQDDPTQVKDLRVLGMKTESPELMLTSCPDPDKLAAFIKDPANLATWSQDVTLSALVLDPAGAGRAVEWELFACAWPGDRTCEKVIDRVKVGSGTTTGGEWSYTFKPGPLTLPGRTEDGRPQLLLQQVLEQDTYSGLGGLRMPLVLHLKVGTEEIWAQKLMVFSCKLFPEQAQNVVPVLPGMLLEAKPWLDTPQRTVKGPGPFKMVPEDFIPLQENYVVPSFQLQPVHLTESWKLAWHASSGKMSQYETGGTGPDGEVTRSNVEWTPAADAVPTDVTFWIVVRDGRGGENWLSRTLHHDP